jgi:ribonuclease HII
LAIEYDTQQMIDSAARQLIAGVDEAGRGPLAGPVYAAAVILNPNAPIAGIKDSKKLSPAQRALLAQQIKQTALAWHVAWADVEEIDSLNILQATMLAMRRAVAGLGLRPDVVRVDGNRMPALQDMVLRTETIVRGDATVPAISAASILAKHGRDLLMGQLDFVFPGYKLAIHKGYPTAGHLAALAQMGPSPLHRRSFGPVRDCISSLEI